MNTDKLAVRLLVDVCRRNGIRRVVICPGSRSAPLVMAFTAAENIECISLADERVAGYYALGISQQTKEPVAVVCTSGTAALNLSPAMCEAAYLGVRVVAITADRPAGAWQQAENQTIRQKNIFRPNGPSTIEVNGDASQLKELKQIALKLDSAFRQSMAIAPYPMHFNVKLSEPLYNTSDVTLPKLLSKKSVPPKSKVDINALKKLQNTWHSSAKKMIVAGLMHPDKKLLATLKRISLQKDVVFIHEPLSNVGTASGIYNADACITAIREDDILNFKPDVLVTIGRQLISKKLKKFLKESDAVHWDLTEDLHYPNGRKLTRRKPEVHKLRMSEALSVLSGNVQPSGIAFKSKWFSLSKRVQSVTSEFISAAPYSDFHVHHKIQMLLPDRCQIHYGNSSPVRYGSLFIHKPYQQVFANRGTSGIDGCLSTASGAAGISDFPVYCILGDVSFLYDSNALWNKQLSPHLKIIVINNGGGNIFRLIDGPDKTYKFETFFETEHQLDISHLARMYGLRYYICARQKDLEKSIINFVNSNNQSASILEIKTDGLVSAETFKNYFKKLRQLHEKKMDQH